MILLLLFNTLVFSNDLDLYKQGRVHYLNQEWRDGAEIYMKLIKEYPNSSYVDPSRYYLGYCLFNQGYKKQAFNELATLLKTSKSEKANFLNDAKALSLKVAFNLAPQDPQMLEYLKSELNDENPDIRFEAACFLAELNNKSGLEVLFNKVQTEKDSLLRDRAVRYIIKVGDKKDKERLDKILKDLQGQTSKAAPKMVRLIVRDLNENSEKVRINVPISLFTLVIRSMDAEQLELIQAQKIDLEELAKSVKDLKPGTTILEVRDAQQEIIIYVD